MERRLPDISKIKKLIDFKPSYGIREIIEDVIEFYKTSNSFLII